jgi:hypothetical protein
MKIIALSGGMGSGKDTAAEHLIRCHGYMKLSFSSALKDITASMFGWDRTMLEGVSVEARAKREELDPWWSEAFDEDITPRIMLQRLATEVMRDTLHPDIWMLIVKRIIENAPPDSKFVITDARFFNEIELLQSLGGRCFGIYRTIPSWLDGLYRHVDYKLNDEFGLGLMDMELKGKHKIHGVCIGDMVREFAKGYFQDTGLKVHQSEWELYLFNSYEGNIHNTGTLENLYSQLDAIA